MAEELGLGELKAHALINIGTAKSERRRRGRAPRTSSEPSRSPPRQARPRWHARPTTSQSRTGCSVTCAAGCALMDEAVAHRRAPRRGEPARFSRNVKLWLHVPGGGLGRGAPAHRGVHGSMRSGEAPLPRGRHASPPRSCPAGARRRRRRARRHTEGGASRAASGRSPAAFRGCRGVPACSSRQEGRRGAGSCARGRSSRVGVLGLGRSRVRRRRARVCRQARRAARTQRPDEVD